MRVNSQHSSILSEKIYNEDDLLEFDTSKTSNYWAEGGEEGF